MGYRKQYTYSAREPATNAPQKTISILIDDQPVWKQTILCDRCKNYFRCVFQRHACKIATECIQLNHRRCQHRGKEINIKTYPDYLERVQQNVSRIIAKNMGNSK